MKKPDYKHGRFTILNTDTCQFSYEDYVDYCEQMDETPDTENSIAFWDWCYEETNTNFEADMDNIRFCDKYKVNVTIDGAIGAWDGNHEIEPVICDNVAEAINKCLSGNYDKIVRAYWDNGVIEVSVSHHDGTNCFTIRPTDKRRKLPYLYAV